MMKKFLLSLLIFSFTFLLVGCSNDNFEVIEKRFEDNGYTIVEDDSFVHEDGTEINYNLSQFEEYDAIKVYVVKDSLEEPVGIVVEFKDAAAVDAFLAVTFNNAEYLDEFAVADLKYENFFLLPFDDWSIISSIFQGEDLYKKN